MLIRSLKFNSKYKSYLERNGIKRKIHEYLTPYSKWVESFCDEDVDEFNMIPEELDEIPRVGVYICPSDFIKKYLEHITNYKFVSNRCYAKGTCDNVKQIYDRYEKVSKYSKRFFIISLEPIFRDDLKDDFKWMANGEYIGVKEKKKELLNDEPEIKFVFKYLIYEVKERFM